MSVVFNSFEFKSTDEDKTEIDNPASPQVRSHVFYCAGVSNYRTRLSKDTLPCSVTLSLLIGRNLPSLVKERKAIAIHPSQKDDSIPLTKEYLGGKRTGTVSFRYWLELSRAIETVLAPIS